MARVQTRRSVSMSRATYDKIKAHCEARGIPMSRWLEEQVAMLPASPLEGKARAKGASDELGSWASR